MKITQPRTDGPPQLLAGDVGSGGGGGGGGTITVTGLQGVPVCTDAPALDEVLTFDGTKWCSAPAAGGGSAIEALDEGSSLTAALASLDFVGAGVTASAVGDALTVTIPGGGGIFFNVKDYGAVGDDTADDTAAIQAAIDAAIANGGGTIYCPAGIYKVTATLDIDPGVLMVPTVLGDGAFYAASSTIRMATANTTAFAVNANADHTIFERLKIQGPGGGSSGDGINAAKAVNLVYTTIWQFYNGLHLQSGSYYARTYGAMFYANVNRGILCDPGGNNTAIIATHVHSSAVGIDFLGCLSPKVIGGSVEACTTAGIRANGGTNAAGLEVSAVYFEQGDGIPDILLGDASAVYGTTISGNTHVKSSYSGTGWAIDAPNAVGLVITGDSIDSSEAIRVNGSSTACTVVEVYLRNAGTVTIPAGSHWIRGGTSIITGETVGGDLSGTLPDPTVAKINGITISGAPDGTKFLRDDGAWSTVPGGSSGGIGPILVTDTPAGSPLIFADLLQNDAGTDLLYADA